MKGYPIQPLSPLPRVFLDPSHGVEDWGPQKKKNSEGQSTKKKVERAPSCQQVEIHRGKR